MSRFESCSGLHRPAREPAEQWPDRDTRRRCDPGDSRNHTHACFRRGRPLARAGREAVGRRLRKSAIPVPTRQFPGLSRASRVCREPRHQDRRGRFIQNPEGAGAEDRRSPGRGGRPWIPPRPKFARPVEPVGDLGPGDDRPRPCPRHDREPGDCQPCRRIDPGRPGTMRRRPGRRDRHDPGRQRPRLEGRRLARPGGRSAGP
jgi:hypothetical protein